MLWLIDLANNGEIPLIQRYVWCRASRKHRKTALEILSWWDSPGKFALLATPSESTRKEAFAHWVTSWYFFALLSSFPYAKSITCLQRDIYAPNLNVLSSY